MTNHIVLSTSLNVRSSPRATADSTILGVLPFGSVIEELDANADRSWLRIRVGMLEGWVSYRYLLLDEAYQASPWMAKAVAEFGVTEVSGPGSNRRIQAFLATTPGAGSSDETAWCSAFAKWCVLQARALNDNIPDLKKISTGARSWHQTNWGTDLTATAPLGSIVVLWRRREPNESGGAQDNVRTPGQVKKSGTGGHVGFLAEPFHAGDSQITLLGGNQKNCVCKSSYALGNNYGLLSIRGLK